MGRARAQTTYLPSATCGPAGESWGHAATTRVILYWRDNERYAHVYKSPCLPPATAHYLVTPEGIRGPRPPQARSAAEKRPVPDGGFQPGR